MAVVDSGLVPGIVPDSTVLPASQSLIEGETLEDDAGHGSHMTQLVHSVAPGASILVLKAVDRGGNGDAATVATAVRYATEQHVDVILLSLEGGAFDAPLESALQGAVSAGALVVMAAGNEQLDLDRFARYPASYDIADSLVVAAIDSQGALSAGTNWGITTVDMAAPGSDIPVHAVDGSPTTISGSSPAAALTAGAAALLLGSSPDSTVQTSPATASDVARALTAGAKPEPALTGKVATAGRLYVAEDFGCL